MTDQHIIDELKRGNSRVLRDVYVHLKAVTSYVLKNSGSSEDGHDVFQESVIVFHRNSVKEDFQLTSTIGTYLYAIGRRIWLNKLRKRKVTTVDIDISHDANLSESFEFELPEYASDDLSQKIQGLMNDIGETCREILHLFYFKKQSLEEIKERLAYSSSQVVRQQKYRCMKKLKEKVEEIPSLN